MPTLHALPEPLQDPVNGPVSIPSGVEKLPLSWVWTSSRRSESDKAIWDGRGLRSSRGISSLYGKALHGVDGHAHVKEQGRYQGRIQHRSTLALVHHAIGLGLLCKVDTRIPQAVAKEPIKVAQSMRALSRGWNKCRYLDVSRVLHAARNTLASPQDSNAFPSLACTV